MSEPTPMTTPNFTPDWTKTGDVFVDRVGNEYRKPTPRGFENVNTQWPWWLYLGDGSSRCYTHSGTYHAFANCVSHDFDIVSQYTPAPSPQGVEVPQWCRDAAKAIDIALRYENPEPYSVSLVAEIIAKHAPQPEATPATNTAGETCCEWAHVSCNDFVEGVDKLIEDCEDGTVIIERPTAPAATDAGEVQATTPKPEKPKTVLKKEGESFRPVEREANLSTVQVERMLAESWKIIKNAEATPRWPRYFEPVNDRGVHRRRRFDGPNEMWWVETNTQTKGPQDIRHYEGNSLYIETDAEGNALSNSPETDEQRASRILGDPMRRVEMNTRDETPAHPVCRGCNQPLKAENAWISDGCPCNNPRGINHGLVPKECCTCDQCDPAQTGSTRKPTTSQPIEQQQASDYDLDLGGGEENLRSQLVALDKMHRDLLKKQLPQQQASGVERYIAQRDGCLCRDKEYISLREGTEVVTAADHDRIVREKDAEIERLRAFETSWFRGDGSNKSPLLAERDATIAELQQKCDAKEHYISNVLLPHSERLGRAMLELRTFAEAAEADAEAAEAKCAELEKEVNFNFSLMKKCDAELRDKSETLERIDNLVMRGDAKCVVEEVRRVCSELGQARTQLAAANERVAAAYRERDDILAQKGEAQGERSREVKNLTAQLATANERVAALEKDAPKGHYLCDKCGGLTSCKYDAVEVRCCNCETLLSNTTTVESQFMRAVKAENQLAELRSTSSIYERDMHAALDRITDATDRIAKVFGESIGHGLPIDGPLGCVQWSLDGYVKLRDENERLAKERDGLREVLQMLVDDVTERNDMDSPSTNPGIKVAVKNALAALAKPSAGVGK